MSMNQLIKELPGLLAYYPHVAGSGSVLRDYSGNGNNGAISGATWRKNVNGFYTLDYDGVNDYTTINETDLLTNEGTTAFWFKRNGIPPSNEIMFSISNSGNTNFFYFAVFSSTGYLQLDNGAGGTLRIDYETNVCDNNWHHVVFTSDGSTNKLYIDGTQATFAQISGTNDGTYYNDIGSVNTANFGTLDYNSGGKQFLFDGEITGVMFADEEWSPELINQIYRKTYIQ